MIPPNYKIVLKDLIQSLKLMLKEPLPFNTHQECWSVSTSAAFGLIVNAATEKKQDEVSSYLGLMDMSVLRLYFEPQRNYRIPEETI